MPRAALIVGAYDQHSTAEHALEAVRETGERETGCLLGAAVVIRDADGHVEAPAGGEPGHRGTRIGLLAGAAAGVLFPPSIVAAAAAGAGVGFLRDRSRKKRRAVTAAVENTVPPDAAGVVLLVPSESADRFDTALTTARRVTKTPVDDRVLDELVTAGS